MFNRKMRLDPPVRCSCGQSKVDFCLKVRSFTKMLRADEEPEPFDLMKIPVIQEGTQLMTSTGTVSDYLSVEGVCQDISCNRKHKAKLEVKGGYVKGILKGTVMGDTETEEAKRNYGIK